MRLTGFENGWQSHLHARILALDPKHLSNSCRSHVSNDGEAGVPWRAWGGASVAADVGCVVGDDYVQMVVAT